MHDWHVDHGATFENVGQWKRAWYFPRDGEDMDAAVARESRAARGRRRDDGRVHTRQDRCARSDAGNFSIGCTTNVMSSLASRGAVRVMCNLDGMVFDDGTVAGWPQTGSWSPPRPAMRSPVLEWMEEWLQTEWPDLNVSAHLGHRAVGHDRAGRPGSGTVLARLAPDFSPLPFMKWREATVAGLAARVFRISFSGELAYEINVPTWHGYALWEALMAAGKDLTSRPTHRDQCTSSGEKGYPIIGQDNDGTVTPDDLGSAGPSARARRTSSAAIAGPPAHLAHRPQTTGRLLPDDPALRLVEGAHIVETDDLGNPPGALLGHVTSSYASEALGGRSRSHWSPPVVRGSGSGRGPPSTAPGVRADHQFRAVRPGRYPPWNG